MKQHALCARPLWYLTANGECGQTILVPLAHDQQHVIRHAVHDNNSKHVVKQKMLKNRHDKECAKKVKYLLEKDHNLKVNCNDTASMWFEKHNK